PLSAILVKPDGKRSLLNYKGDTQTLPADAIDFSGLSSKTALFDGHEPHLSLALLAQLRNTDTQTVLDAGSVHEGTLALMDKVDYLVCSEKFALQTADNEQIALSRLSTNAPAVVITLGERGLIWQRGQESGRLPSPPVAAIDTTGAGDAFHGAFAVALATGMEWLESLRFASAAGALCCTKIGARPGLPDKQQVRQLLSDWQFP
ncbi:MAG: PfkB family carbohydrate kinase, partial [Methylomonas sp.]|nr:PfkB family carbohydrate kinase [Methylomonas sp.]